MEVDGGWIPTRVDVSGWWGFVVEMGKAGGCEKRRRRRGRVGGRPSYIDEGRARMPRDHTVERGGAKPCWGRGGLQHQSKKQAALPLQIATRIKCLESCSCNCALAWQGRRAARAGCAVPGAAWPVRRTPTPDASTTITIAGGYSRAESRLQLSRCLLKYPRVFIRDMPCYDTSSPPHCFELAILPIYSHCTLDTEGTMNLNTAHITRKFT